MQGMYMTSHAPSLFDADSQVSGLFETGSHSYKCDPHIDEAARCSDEAVTQRPAVKNS